MNELKITDVVDQKAFEQLERLKSELDSTFAAYKKAGDAMAEGLKIKPGPYSELISKAKDYYAAIEKVYALEDKIKRIQEEQKNVLLEHLYHKPLINPDDLYNELQEYKKMIEPFVCDTSLFLNNAIKEGKEVLLEGQLGSLKDPDHGIYPMVTSSSTLAGYGAIGAGIPPYEIKKIVTVCKAYSSAVGAGAFVSEIFGDEADELRRRGGDGGEFGATTGRPRRMGWFDCVASKYGCRMQGSTDVAFTVLDVLGYLDEIPVCVGYDIDGEVTTDFPTTHLLEKAKPVLKKLPGWKSDIRGIKKYEDLPENCRKSPRTTLRQHNRMHAPHCQACPFRTYCFSPPFPYSLNLLPPLSLSFLCSIRRCYAAQTHTKQICLSRSPPKFMP